MPSDIRDNFFLPKNLDPPYKMDLDLWDCVGKVKLMLPKSKFHRTAVGEGRYSIQLRVYIGI